MIRVSNCVLFASLLACSFAAHAEMDDDPLMAVVFVEELEWQTQDGEGELAWDAGISVGKIRDKLLLQTEGERSAEGTEDFETRLLYSRAVLPFWNLNVGWRGDWQPEQRRNWLAVELDGLAPGFVDSRLSAYLSDKGRAAARLEMSVEWYLTPSWKLVPGAEVNAYGQSDSVNGLGSGLASIELSARFLYKQRPDFMPYLGVEVTRLTGATADFARLGGDSSRSYKLLAGLHFWF